MRALRGRVNAGRGHAAHQSLANVCLLVSLSVCYFFPFPRPSDRLSAGALKIGGPLVGVPLVGEGMQRIKAAIQETLFMSFCVRLVYIRGQN